MKKIILLFTILIIAVTSYCQPCPTTNIRLSSQAQIDSFPILYPGCNVINFIVRIGSESSEIESDITNLNGLSSLERVKSQIYIENTDILQSLEGLENLKRTHSTFSISNNEQLIDISHLQSIDSSYFIRIESNPMLNNYDILEQLSYLSGLTISGDNTMQDLTTIPALSSLTFLTISNCESLASLDGILNYSQLKTLRLYNNAGLADLELINSLPSLTRLTLSGLDGLNNLDGLLGIDTLSSLDVVENSNIINLQGLRSIRYFGSLTIENNASLQSLQGLDSLNHVGTLTIDNNGSLQELQGLNNSFTAGVVNIKNNSSLLSLAGFEQIQQLQEIYIENNNRIKNLQGLENLENVEQTFAIINNDSLETLEGYNNSEGPHTVYFEECGFYYNDYGLIIRDNSSLENLEGLSHLDLIFGNLQIINNDKLTQLTGLNNIKDILGSNLIISENDGLENLNSLANLENIGYGDKWYLRISNNPKITNLNGLNKLKPFERSAVEIVANKNLVSLDGLKKPTELESIYISSNPKLTDINVFDNLNKLNFLGIRENGLIENLDVFSNLSSPVNSISLRNNDRLDDISGLQWVESIIPYECYGWEFDGSLSISGNPLLSKCAIMPICDALTDPNVDKYIVNNGVGCNSPEDINCDEVSISGFVFYDFNQNGLLDGGENGISNIGINFNPPDRNILTKTGGKYFQVCEEGVEYEISFPDLENYTLTTPSDKYTITFQSGNAINYDNNFGVYPIEELHDVVSNISSNSTRCNRRVDFFLSIENIGAFVENGYLRLDFDSLSSYSWSLPKADSINLESNFLLWDIEDFAPFDFEQIDVQFDMPDETYTGTLLNFTSSVTLDSAGTDIKVDEYTYSPTVLCSYDPNDKLAMPAGVYSENYTLKDEKMTYTVRFQNTGNAPAIDVTIVDTLSDFLDIETFRVVNSSFTPQTIIDGREVTFLFSNINLVDSISDERNSHGFVTFEINPIAEIDDYTEIKNTAHIIFDSNAAIITNTVKNTMVTTIPTDAVDDQELIFYNVYPNPINPDQRLIIEYELDEPKNDIMISMYNNLGQEILSMKGQSGLNELDIKGTLPGIYFIGLKHNEQLIKATKVIIQ